MTEVIRNRTIRPSSRKASSKSYKIDTKTVVSGDLLVVNIDHESNSFLKRFTFKGRDVAPRDSISFRVHDYGNKIEITWSGATPVEEGGGNSVISDKPILQPESKPKRKELIDGKIQSLDPVIDEKTQILILGTMPGAESLKQQAYYGHPRNLFWKLISEVVGRDAPESYASRQSFLLKYKIGLWDMCQSCIREGSLDENISHESPNDLKDLLSNYPKIKVLAFNGVKAFKLYGKHFDSISTVHILPLPSTSPANAGMSWDKKVEKWMEIKEHL